MQPYFNEGYEMVEMNINVVVMYCETSYRHLSDK